MSPQHERPEHQACRQPFKPGELSLTPVRFPKGGVTHYAVTPKIKDK
jgi:hypothetical protein